MSYKKYLDEFGKKVETKVGNFKEDIVNSKEFVNAFLDLTNENNDEVRDSLFDTLMERIEDVCTDTLKEK
tara:strand:- start:26774 stop:26983 length:210 start_codon:yes stop_codon:yes gene_type:complete